MTNNSLLLVYKSLGINVSFLIFFKNEWMNKMATIYFLNCGIILYSWEERLIYDHNFIKNNDSWPQINQNKWIKYFYNLIKWQIIIYCLCTNTWLEGINL